MVVEAAAIVAALAVVLRPLRPLLAALGVAVKKPIRHLVRRLPEHYSPLARRATRTQSIDAEVQLQ